MFVQSSTMRALLDKYSDDFVLIKKEISDGLNYNITPCVAIYTLEFEGEVIKKCYIKYDENSDYLMTVEEVTGLEKHSHITLEAVRKATCKGRSALNLQKFIEAYDG